ncbi:hypothetical protein V8F33_009501, partial [Rhypophila sp. PSN 637]
EHRRMHRYCSKFVDVCSLPYTAFLRTFGHPHNFPTVSPAFDRLAIESTALHLIDRGAGTYGMGFIVIRSVEHGCLVVSESYPLRWFPPFHPDKSKLTDVRGSGTAFLGAFALMLGNGANLTEAAIMGTVAASFAVEQTAGLPYRAGFNDNTRETWNGVEVSARVAEYR